MQLKHIKESIKQKYSKQGFYRSSRKMSKSLKESYKEGMKVYKESLKNSYKIDNNTIEYLKKLYVKKYKTLKGFSTLKALKDL